MTTNLAKWAPNNGQIIKSGLSDGRRAKFLPSVAGYDYYWLRTGGYLGNVGLTIRNNSWNLNTIMLLNKIITGFVVRVKYLGAIRRNFELPGVLKFLLLLFYSKYKCRDRHFVEKLKQEQQSIFEEIGVSQTDAISTAKAIEPKLKLDPGAVYVERIHAQIFAALKLSGFRPKNILELGTNQGVSSAYLAELFSSAHIFTVDLPANDPAFPLLHPEGEAEYSERTQSRLGGYTNVTTLRLNTSTLMEQDLPDFDLIWLDAGHEHPDVSWDHFYSINKLKPNGWLLSDDILFPGNFLHRHDPRHFHATEVVEYFNRRLPYKFKFIPKRCEPEQHLIFRKYIAVLHKPESE